MRFAACEFALLLFDFGVHGEQVVHDGADQFAPDGRNHVAEVEEVGDVGPDVVDRASLVWESIVYDRDKPLLLETVDLIEFSD